MRWLLVLMLLGCGGGSSASDAGSDASILHADPVGPYGKCVGHPIGATCGTAASLCPSDSTGSVCALACSTDSDCLAVSGASAPRCVQLGPSGTYCVLPCSSTMACPIGMQCLALAGDPQCGWGA